MPYDDLRDFVRALEKRGELKRIPVEVDPHLEITEFADRSVKNGGPAFLFEKPKGSDVPVLINAFASEARMKLALEAIAGRSRRAHRGADRDAQARRADGQAEDAAQAGGSGVGVSQNGELGACKDVILRDEFLAGPLSDPALLAAGWRAVHHSADGVFAQSGYGQTQLRLLSAAGFRRAHHRNALADPQAGRGALPQTRSRREKHTDGRRGGHRRGPVHHVLRDSASAAGSGRDDAGRVPARQAGGDGEVRNVGYRSSGRTRRLFWKATWNWASCAAKDRFGDHTGFYSLEDDYPVFHITCITHRKNPIYATTIVGPPPMEDFYMGKAIERIFLPLMRLQLPEIRDVCMPAEGIFHNLILVSIRKSYPGHARKVMHAIWGLGQAMFSKCIVVVDEDVNVQDVSEVAWKALNNIDPERDIQFVMGPVDSLDHSSRLPNYGSKMGVDATRKWPGEGFTRPWPDVITMPEPVRRRVDELWKQAGLDQLVRAG